MQVTIITIGDELLIGETIDTNSAWMAKHLNEIGINVYEILSVSDDKNHIKKALKQAESTSDIVLITGGLGPTKDDITKNTLAEYFGVGMQYNKAILEKLQEYFLGRDKVLLESNKELALMPENCEPIRNNKGTAWAMWFDENNTVFVSMPGVPYEMKEIMHQEIFPRIKEKFQLPVILHKHILTAGVGESQIAEKIKDIESALPSNIKLAYLPGLGSVKLRLTAKGEDKVNLQHQLVIETDKITELISKYIYGYDYESHEASIGKLLLNKKATLSTAESCTGGYISHLITSVPGSSQYFTGSTIAYSNSVKRDQLGVSENTLKEYGAVSEETVIEMVKGAINLFQTDYAIAVSGVAGPDGGTIEKPVGTIWIAVGRADNIRTRQLNFPGSRMQNIKLTGRVAIEMLRRYIVREAL